MRLLPSSIGLSCLLRPGIERVRLRLSWGEYRRLGEEPAAQEGAGEAQPAAIVEVSPETAAEALAEPEVRWRREPFSWQGALVLEGEEDTVRPAAGVELRRLCRPTRCGDAEVLFLSLFLTNRRAPTRPREEACLFGP